MTTCLITYNLNNDDDDYARLFAKIEQLGETWHDGSKLDSVWFLKTALAPNEIRAKIQAAFDRNDNCFIVDITGQPRSGWMPNTLWTWLSA